MKFRASYCDPFRQNIVELGDIQEDKIIDKFESIPWTDLLRQMELTKEEEIFYSPSLEIENKETKHGLTISVAGTQLSFEFYIFYKRPKMTKSFFGLKEKLNTNYTSDKTGQTKQNVLDCLNALLRNDTEYLATTLGR